MDQYLLLSAAVTNQQAGVLHAKDHGAHAGGHVGILQRNPSSPTSVYAAGQKRVQESGGLLCPGETRTAEDEGMGLKEKKEKTALSGGLLDENAYIRGAKTRRMLR